LDAEQDLHNAEKNIELEESEELKEHVAPLTQQPLLRQ
jgi:hypothetical protein